MVLWSMGGGGGRKGGWRGEGEEKTGTENSCTTSIFIQYIMTPVSG